MCQIMVVCISRLSYIVSLGFVQLENTRQKMQAYLYDLLWSLMLQFPGPCARSAIQD
jgi:hypothetical protein